MSDLEAILGEMDRINTQMNAVVHGPTEGRSEQIVTLRQEFSAETGNLISQLPTDERLRSRPELFSEFQERLADVRVMLTSHQARWSVADIDARRDEYLTATETVHGKIAAYVDWARGSLDQP